MDLSDSSLDLICTPASPTPNQTSIIFPDKRFRLSQGIRKIKNVFACPYCTKIYQFQVSLFSHTKLRHPNQLLILKRVKPNLVHKGLPQRFGEISPIKEHKTIELGSTFFTDLNDDVYELFHTHNEHPLYTKLIEITSNKPFARVKTCDHILAEYLLYLQATQSREQLKMSIKFILLHRANFCKTPTNEFVPVLPTQHLTNDEVTEHTIRLFKWLLENSYTFILLTLIPEKDSN